MTPAPEKCWTCGETGSHYHGCPRAAVQAMPEMVEVESIDPLDIEDEDEDFLDDEADMDRPEWDEHFPNEF